MSYTIDKIHPVTISGHENGPILVWEVTTTDARGRTHKHRVSQTEFNWRLRNNEWYTYPSSDIQMMAR